LVARVGPRVRVVVDQPGLPRWQRLTQGVDVRELSELLGAGYPLVDGEERLRDLQLMVRRVISLGRRRSG